MKNALINHVGMLGDMFLWLVANLEQGGIYLIKQALPPNISAGSVAWKGFMIKSLFFLKCRSCRHCFKNDWTSKVYLDSMLIQHLGVLKK